MPNPDKKDPMDSIIDKLWELPFRFTSAWLGVLASSVLFVNGMMRSHLDFVQPFLQASHSFWEREKERIPSNSVAKNWQDYQELLRFNLQIAEAGWASSRLQMHEYCLAEFKRFAESLLNTLSGTAGEQVEEFFSEKLEVLRRLVVAYPDAIRDIGEEFGFHLQSEGYRLVGETDRMSLYQVLPTEPGVDIRTDLKPIIVVHPYVLGAGIISFLPSEKKSYVHAFANQGVPTYARLVKDIQTTEAVQIMTGEDDARDTAYFSRLVRDIHGKPVTLSGFCQGGFICLADLLSGRLDGLVDALITCVAPMDGTRSKGLVEYLEHITPRFRDLAYATKTLPSGNNVIDGKVMSWVYKLKSIEREAPLFTYFRDINLFEHMVRSGVEGVGKTAAAINHWLIYDRTDLPVAITQMSFDSYTIPISSSGRLPFKLFGKELCLDYLRDKAIRFQICYAAKDDLVDPASALAPGEYVPVEVSEFPKGHAAIATSWSDPDSEYGLHKTFPNGQRGPVRFHLDLDRERA